MKKILFLSVAMAMGIAAYPDTIPEGNVSGTWTLDGSPYLINGTTTVPDGSTLTIESGVVVEWLGNYTMWIEGRILALGTQADSIVFTATDPDVGFKSIRFSSTDPANDSSKFEYCLFEYGNVSGTWPDNCGGAIGAVNYSDFIINYCTFRDNRAVYPGGSLSPGGGAIALWNSSPGIKYCNFINNEALYGGAITILEADPVIEGNSFTGNRALLTGFGQGYGGAIGCYLYSDPVININSFSGNTAENGGGALAFVSGCNPLIDHNLFYQNTAGWGGAIELQDTSTAQIINNTIVDNYASMWGGGVHLWTGSNAQIRNTILSGNIADSTDFSIIGDQVHLQEITDTVNAYYSDIRGKITGVGGPGYAGDWEECIDADPLFEGSDTAYYHLTYGSPCIDTGDPAMTDPDGTRCDMGAFYYPLFQGLFETPSASSINLQIYPNPAGEIVDCRFGIVDFQWVSIQIFDLYGREVRTLLDEAKSPGEYKVRLDVSGLPSGVYLVILKAGEKRAVRKLVLR